MSQKFLDLDGLTIYDRKIKAWINGSTVDITDDEIRALFPVVQPDNEIWYKTADKQLFKLNYYDSDIDIISNEYKDDLGFVKFNDDFPTTLWEYEAFEGIGEIETAAYDYPPNGCDNKLTFIQFPKNHESIPILAGCSYLEEIILPENLKSIQYTLVYTVDGTENIGCFKNCKSLQGIIIPKSVESIYEKAFDGCYFLRDKFINNSSLDAEANNYWGAIIYDQINNGVYISNNSIIRFDKNLNDGTIFIPENITSIPSNIFSNTLIHVDKFINNSSLDAEANNYWGATVYEEITEDGVMIANNIIVGYEGSDGTVDEHKIINIPINVTKINKAFTNLSYIEFNYAGTKEQWNNIEKVYEWNYMSYTTNEEYDWRILINCTDGIVEDSGRYWA